MSKPPKPFAVINQTPVFTSRTVKPAFLDKPGIAEFVCLSVDTLERLVQSGKFPAARQISDKRVGWLVREVEEWAENRPRSGNLPVANCGRNQ